MKKVKWILRWETVHPFYRMEAFFLGHKKALALGSNYNGLLGISRNGIMRMHYSEKDLVRNAAAGIHLFLKKNMMEEYFHKSENNCNKLLSLVNDTILIQKYLTNMELLNRYERVHLHLQELLCSYDLSRPEFFFKVENEIKRFLKWKGTSANEINKYFTLLVSSSENNYLDQETYDWLNLLIRLREKKDKNNRLLKRHQKKYGWIGASEQDKSWDLGYYIDLAKRSDVLSIMELKDNLKRAKNKKILLRNDRERLKKKLGINSDLMTLCDIVGKFSNIRMKIRLAWVESGFLLNNIFDEIERRTSVPTISLKKYKITEIKNLLINNISVPEEILKKRDAYLFKLENGKIRLFEGKDADLILNKEIPNADYSQVIEIIGRVASPGRAIGEVKIINSLSPNQSEEIDIMKKGAVLVTGMTRPHLMEAMRKSSAIVTDEGGIASHAAIVSRELGLPCIIGTKIATKVLKDGDMVEVDAEKGIVRRLGR